MNICLNAGGGLGDILRVYLSGQVGYPWCQPYWGQLEEWKRDTGGKIKLVVASHNPSAGQFFEFVPWIDEVISIPWENDGTLLPAKYAGSGFTPMRDYELINLCSGFRWNQPKIYLSPNEQSEYELIMQSSRKKALIYPFGGYGARLKPERYIYLIQELYRLDYDVIIVGDSYTRNVKDDPSFIEEKFDYTKNVINLVGRDSCRLTSLLAYSADLYIGSIGSYMHAAFGREIKSTILTCKEIWEDNRVFGSNILRNDSLWYLRRYVGSYDRCVDLVSIDNKEVDLIPLWNRIVTRMNSSSFTSEYISWGG